VSEETGTFIISHTSPATSRGGDEMMNVPISSLVFDASDL
jgi:hypothetical protein